MRVLHSIASAWGTEDVMVVSYASWMADALCEAAIHVCMLDSCTGCAP